MGLELKQNLKLSQQLVMTPQLQQAHAAGADASATRSPEIRNKA